MTTCATRSTPPSFGGGARESEVHRLRLPDQAGPVLHPEARAASRCVPDAARGRARNPNGARAVIQEASHRLIAAASELDAISKQLVQTENAIGELEPLYEEHIENYVAELWDECVRDEKKFPPKDVRDSLAIKAMDPELRRNYRAYIRLRVKTKQRLS